MFTKNFKKIINGSFSSSGHVMYNVVDTQGTSRNSSGNNAMSYWNFSGTAAFSHTMQYDSIFVGTGNTAPTADDYFLETMCTDCTNDGGSKQLNQQTGQMTFTKTFTYTGADDADISEIGLFKCSVSDTNRIFLVAREVLENPIHVSNGDTFTVTMTLG